MKLEGYCDPEFDEVRKVFSFHFDQGLEVGAVLVVYHQGKLVVDLAAGLRDRGSGEPYTRDILQPVFSVTKGITAVAANTLADRGALDLNAPVCSYWPEFGAAGNEKYLSVGYSRINRVYSGSISPLLRRSSWIGTTSQNVSPHKDRFGSLAANTDITA